MTDLFFELLNRSLSASWLVLAVLVLRQLLKKAPKCVPILLWGLVAIRLLCPISLESSVSLMPDTTPITQEAVSETIPMPGPEIPADGEIISQSQLQNQSVETHKSISSPQVLSVIWLLGFAAMLAYSVITYIRLHRRMATAIRLQDNIYQCEKVESPFVLGLIHPRIYLPFTIRAQDIPHVLAHEQSHIRHRDHWWKLLGFLLLSAYWFNPLLWIAYILLCSDIELACDERIIRTLGHEARADYSQALLSCSVHRRSMAACPLAFGEANVKKRVQNILNYKKPAFWVILVAIAVCIIAAVCFLTNPKTTSVSPFGHVYQVEGVIYEDIRYNSTMTPDSAPLFSLTSNQELDICEDIPSQIWLQAGTFKEIQLTPENFDANFQEASWQEDSIAKLRENNQAAWKVVVSDQLQNSVVYYLLQQKNEDLYLAFGYQETSSPSAVHLPDSLIRYVWKLIPYEIVPIEEQKAITSLMDSISRESNQVSFTIPPEYAQAQNWDIRIAGRQSFPNGTTTSSHLLEDINEGHLWEAGKTYSIDLNESHYTELRMDINLPGCAQTSFDLLERLPAAEEAFAELWGVRTGDPVELYLYQSPGHEPAVIRWRVGHWDIPMAQDYFRHLTELNWISAAPVDTVDRASVILVTKHYSLSAYEGTTTIKKENPGGSVEWLKPNSDDYFDKPYDFILRSWFDDLEYDFEYDRKDLFVRDKGQIWQEAVEEFAENYAVRQPKVSYGSHYAHTYLKAIAKPNPGITAILKQAQEIDENTYCFDLTVVFVPETERALTYAMPGNTSEYTGDDPSVPDGAYEYYRCCYIHKEADGWHVEIGSTSF